MVLKKRKLVLAITSIVLIAILCLSIILIQNNFQFNSKTVTIPVSDGTLSGKLILPKDLKTKAGLVVFIHGDGAANASYNHQYEPLWELLSRQGYASLSWSKPGVDGSTGNWLNQSMDDRAKEAEDVIKWARKLPEIDKNKIGLWGASQAGWVIPKIVQLDNNIAFNILVAPAVNWLDQGLYNTIAELKKEGKSSELQKKAIADYKWSVSMLKRNVPFKEYSTNSRADKDMTKDRWNFILKNYKADSTKDIQKFYSPVKLFLGGKDVNVDSENTKKVFKKEIPQNILSISWIPTTDHFMLKAPLVNSKVLTTLTAVFAPRELADQKYYDGIKEFLSSIKKNTYNKP